MRQACLLGVHEPNTTQPVEGKASNIGDWHDHSGEERLKHTASIVALTSGYFHFDLASATTEAGRWMTASGSTRSLKFEGLSILVCEKAVIQFMLNAKVQNSIAAIGFV